MAERLAPTSVLGARMRVNDLFVSWLASPEGSSTVEVIIAEHLAAARQPPAPLEDVQPASGASSAASSPAYFDPHTPSTPPPRHLAARPASLPNNAEPTSPARYLGVDEVDMFRQLSPGGASPVSPNHALGHNRGAVIDPHLPRSPDTAGRVPPTTRRFPVDEGSLLGVPASGSASRAASPVSAAHHAQHVSGQRMPVATYDDIPRFYGTRTGRVVTSSTNGRPLDPAAATVSHDNQQSLEALAALFAPNAQVRRTGAGGTGAASIDMNKGLRKNQFDKVCTDVFHLPGWLKEVVFKRVLVFLGIPDNGTTLLRYNDIRRYFEANLQNLTINRRLFEMIRSPDSKREYITNDELAGAAKQLVKCHPGLEFLTQAEFQELYCKTVATRIVYHNERKQSRTVSWHDFDRSDVPGLMRDLDQVQDINAVLKYFSYEHFYVLYCRFWELDTDRNHRINLRDLSNYGQGALTQRVLERVIKGAGHKLCSQHPGELEFEDFIYFCLSEEDKNSAPAKRYWFNVVDIDSDGIISGHEMAYFFEEQAPRIEEIAGDDLKYPDMLCQMLDMFVPNLSHAGGITLAEIRDCATAEHFFNMLFNATKFWQFEHRDPFAEHQARHAPEKTAWDRFARTEYDRMAREAQQ